MKDGRKSPSLHLDLSNFQDGMDSRYVLTSPRSLEACAQLGVRPVELLQKTLDEVREENPEAADHQLNDLYISLEKERCRKLEMCRELRNELLQRDWKPDRGDSLKGHEDGLPLTSIDRQDQVCLSTEQYDTLDTKTNGHKDCPLGSLNPPTIHRTPQNTKNQRVSPGTLQRSFSQGDILQTEQEVRRIAMTVGRELWASVPKRDRKIAALMLLKNRQEEMFKLRGLQVQQAWDKLKTEERSIRAALDKRDWLNQLQLHRRRSWSSQLDLQVDPIYMSCYQDQKALLKYGLTKVISDLKIENAFYDRTSIYSPEERMVKTIKAKMIKDLQERKNIQIKNEYEKLRHSKLKEKVDNQTKAEEHVRRLSIQQKEQRSKEIQEKLAEERSKGLNEKAFREDKQKVTAKLRAMRFEKEQMEHKKMLAQLSDHRTQQATDTLERSIQNKAERARGLNVTKERAHQALKQKVDQEMEKQRKEIAYFIRMKDQKSQKLREEKEATVEEGRRIARASFQFREKIRQQTKSKTFDQMALQAQLNASFLKSIP